MEIRNCACIWYLTAYKCYLWPFLFISVSNLWRKTRRGNVCFKKCFEDLSFIVDVQVGSFPRLVLGFAVAYD
jgi:hypothetical protein